jgi:hypothetical protein
MAEGDSSGPANQPTSIDLAEFTGCKVREANRHAVRIRITPPSPGKILDVLQTLAEDGRRT